MGATASAFCGGVAMVRVKGHFLTSDVSAGNRLSTSYNFAGMLQIFHFQRDCFFYRPNKTYTLVF